MNELTISSGNIIESLDLQAIQTVMNKIKSFQSIVKQNLVVNHDYGVIPSVKKPSLFKPGGEKICMIFGINPEYSFLSETEDYKADFFAYNVKCTLYKNGTPCAQGVGSCNSKEKKYRWINVDKLPDGYAGPSEVFTDSYGYVKYKIENPDICSFVNTILKMAKKRAFIDAVLQVASLSEVFTQDIEDYNDFVKEESKAAYSSMTPEESGAIKIRFGKHKGKTLKEIFKEDRSYLDWLHGSEKTDAAIKRAIEVMFEALKNKTKQKNEKQDENVEKNENPEPPVGTPNPDEEEYPDFMTDDFKGEPDDENGN